MLGKANTSNITFGDVRITNLKETFACFARTTNLRFVSGLSGFVSQKCEYRVRNILKKCYSIIRNVS
ncbi:MAG: hypothetical protein EOO34_00010 [Cyanobacteriota bacterium]|nr:MAG: hypothetical protein EOO34_00010 [Cyanobacteriota bacterium]